MKTLNLFCASLLLLFNVYKSNAQVEGGITCYTPDNAASSSAVSCTDLEHFIPTESTPILTVRLAFHIIQREDPFPKGNFDETNEEDVDFLHDVFERLNDLFALGQEQWCNCGWVETNHIRDSRIRFEWADEGIYYHRDNVGYVNNNGTHSNNYNFNNYASCAGSDVLNVFFSNPPLNTSSGVSTGSYVGMFNWYDEYIQGNTNPWGTGNLLGHEIGHMFGLQHSFCASGRLSDMCQSEALLTSCNNGPWCAETSTDCTCGNNFMSYSRLADYISELQMATMHRRLTTNEGTSKFLKLDLQQTPIVINQSGVEWEEARIVHNDVQILPGASLRISCRVVMPKDSRIIVKRGGRLIVDGGVITSKGPTTKDCNGDEIPEFTRWLGIEVWGNTSVSTSTSMLSESFPLQSTDPGVVILKNNALIEHARVGVFPQQRGTTWEEQLEHFGGLISVNNAEFRDCWKGVEYVSHFPIRSSSRFIDARFTQTYIGTALPFPIETDFNGITSWQVKGIIFDECEFLNLRAGITMLNADFKIERSLFQKNTRGISIGATTPGLGLLTEIGDFEHGNIFESCNLPVSVLAYDLAEIEDNTIRSCPVGVYVEGPSSTIIQLNEFQNNALNNNPALSIGIGITQTGEGLRNLIRCNEWTLTSSVLSRDGILVYGDNRSTLFNDNKFRCKYDVKIVQYDEDETQAPGILPDQFLGTSSNPRAVYNEFTGFTTMNHSNEIHTPNPSIGLTQPFRYFHPNGTCPDPNMVPPGGSEYIPRRPVHGTCVQSPSFNFTNRSANGVTSLNCTVPPRPDIVLDAECKTVHCLTNLYPKISSIKTVLDGGDISSLYSSIQTSPNSTTTLNNLTAVSPWLSNGVLQELLASSMTESNKKSILSNNVPLPSHIMAQAQQTLSTEAYNYLVGLSTSSKMPARDSLQGNMLSLINSKAALLRHIVDSLVALEEFSEADDLLAADGGRYARECRIGLKILQGNLEGAKSMLNTWPDSETSDIEFANLMSMYFDYTIDGKLPSSTDSTTLMDNAFSSSNQASRAKSLAGAFYGMLFEPLFPKDEMEGFSQPINPHPSSQVNNELLSQFEVFPNPAADNIKVILNVEPNFIPKDDKTTLCIYDTKGSIMHKQYLQANNSDIDISTFIKGIYIITVYSGDQYLGVKRFFKQ